MRKQRGAMTAAATVAAVLAVGLGAWVSLLAAVFTPGEPGVQPKPQLRLPSLVHTPGEWLDEQGPTGPLAALGTAERTEPVGLTDRSDRWELFGVSATDGRSVWIDHPDLQIEHQAVSDWYALSPDGRLIGWELLGEPRPDSGALSLVGWAVMDTTTGDVRRLDPPRRGRWLCQNGTELTFTGDSQYLVGGFSVCDRWRRHQYVALDVRNGTPLVLEPRARWIPVAGSAPTGVVWSQGRVVHRVDPATGRHSTRTMPRPVVTASWAPDDTAFAYIGSPRGGGKGRWRLYAGRSLAEARHHSLPLRGSVDLLGWRDNRHVVVDDEAGPKVVDIVTGRFEGPAIEGYVGRSTALLAEDLWRHPTRRPPEPTGTSDPRQPYLWLGGGLLAVASVLVALRGPTARRVTGA